MKAKLMNARNMIVPLLYQAFAMVWALIIPRMILGKYGVSIHGLTSTITTIMNYVVLLSGGIGIVAAQSMYAPIAKQDTQKVAEIYNAIRHIYVRVSVVYVIAIFLVALLLPIFIGDEIDKATVFSLMIIMGLQTVVNTAFFSTNAALLQADNKYYMVNILYIVEINFRYLSEYYLIKNGAEIGVILGVPAISILITSIVCELYIKKSYPYLSKTKKRDESALENRKSGMIHQIAGLVVNSTDVLTLTIFTNQIIVSIYTVYSFVIVHIHNILNIMFSYGQVAKFGHLISINPTKLQKQYDKYERFFYAVMSVTYGLVAVLFLPFVKLYVSDVSNIDYQNVWLAVLFWIIGFMNSVRIPALMLINAKGDYKETQFHAIIEAIINLIVSFSLVWKFGIYGVLIGTIASFTFRTNQVILYTNKKILRRSSLKSFRNIACAILAIWLDLIIHHKFGFIICNWIQWLYVAMRSGVLFIIIAALFYTIITFIDRK